jgi:hypothetical protein
MKNCKKLIKNELHSGEVSHYYRLLFSILHAAKLSESGVGNLQPLGRMWPSQLLYAARHMVRELANAISTNFFATEEH